MHTVTWNRATPAGVTDPDHVRTLVALLEEVSVFSNTLGHTFKCDALMTSPECMCLLSAVGDCVELRLPSEKADYYNKQWFVSYSAPEKDEIWVGVWSPGNTKFFAKVKLENFI